MITVGCIQTLKCHSNACPVGVATTDPDLQKALVTDEKKHRTANYVITMRKGLFRIAAAAGLDSPAHFKQEHIVYKDDKGIVQSMEDIYQAKLNTNCSFFYSNETNYRKRRDLLSLKTRQKRRTKVKKN